MNKDNIPKILDGKCDLLDNMKFVEGNCKGNQPDQKYMKDNRSIWYDDEFKRNNTVHSIDSTKENKPNDLDINKALAELKGHELCSEWDCAAQPGDVLIGRGNGDLRCFNPITDKSLNLDLRDEFEVTINYSGNFAFIPANRQRHRGICTVKFTDKSEINRTVCLVILESFK